MWAVVPGLPVASLLKKRSEKIPLGNIGGGSCRSRGSQDQRHLGMNEDPSHKECDFGQYCNVRRRQKSYS
jgi:hypothetical protein